MVTMYDHTGCRNVDDSAMSSFLEAYSCFFVKVPCSVCVKEQSCCGQ